MNICYIASDVVIPHHRGASTHTFEVSRHLVKRGHGVDVLCRRGVGQLAREDIDGVTVHRVQDGIFLNNPFSSYNRPGDITQRDGRRILRSVYGLYFTQIYPLYVGLKAVEIIKARQSDLVLERETSFGAGGIASYVTSRPLVLEIIGPRYSMISARRASEILYYNPTMLVRPMDHSKLTRVSAAVNTDLFKFSIESRQKIRSLLNISQKIVVGYSGTFADWQGVASIVEAASNLRHLNPQVHFLMIGPYFGPTKEYVFQEGLASYFTFVGSVNYEEMPEYLSASDILLAPYDTSKSAYRKSFGIGSSLKIFEYMACSRPVIASAIYPIAEEISGDNAYLIRPGDVHALTSAIQNLATNPKEYDRLAKAGRRLVEDRYSWELFVEALEGKMVKVLESNKKVR